MFQIQCHCMFETHKKIIDWIYVVLLLALKAFDNKIRNNSGGGGNLPPWPQLPWGKLTHKVGEMSCPNAQRRYEPGRN